MQTLFEWDFNGCNDSRIFDILVRNAGEFAPGAGYSSYIKDLIAGIL